MAKKVFVGLSGGVDSAVSAAILKEQGYDVTGAFIKIWQPEFVECTWERDRLDALRVCAALEIPFREIDLSDVYKKEIITDLVEGYKKGLTPNPDVLCNAKIKFGAFAAWAFREGADVVATGHYARIEKRETGHALLRGLDRAKDQSYFLWQLTEHDLARTLFPVGGMQKADVRAYAARHGLPVARKHDSQGLCFVGDITMSEFLSRYIPLTAGDVLDERGAVIGTHTGVAQYTLGQRHGFFITHGASEGPHFVVALDISKNTITVSPDRERAASKTARIGMLSQLSKLPQAARVEVQTRYREEPIGAILTTHDGEADVTFDVSRIAVPGQSLVCYQGDELVGGGVITA